jgi:hypothetical protein
MVRKLYYITCMNNERRGSGRLACSLPITLHDSRVKSKNISPEGVYFEVTTKDIENYSPGKVIMIEIEFTNSQFGLPERTERLIGFGEVVRVDGIDINNHDKKLGVALKFCEELKVYEGLFP